MTDIMTEPVPFYHPTEGWFLDGPITEDEAEAECGRLGIPFRRGPADSRITSHIISTRVVGTGYTKGSGDIIRTLKGGQYLQLLREPSNRYDSRAVSVNMDGIRLGYIPRDSNGILSEIMDSGVGTYCRVSEGHKPGDRELRVDVFQELPFRPAVRHISRYPECGGDIVSLDSVPVTMDSLNLGPMANHRNIIYRREFSEDDMWNLSWGHRFGGWEDRWSLVSADGMLHIARTAIGESIFTIVLGDDGVHELMINTDYDQMDEDVLEFIDGFLDTLLTPIRIPWSALPFGIIGNIRPYVDGKEHGFRVEEDRSITLLI